MNILIACEESQKVCSEFRKLGHVAYSCDIQEPSGRHPEWHINDDVLPLLNGDCTFITMDGTEHSISGKWDMLIAFPPCFVADTLVMTYDGLKPISNICVGDLVLTHLGRFKRVTSVMMHEASNLCKVKSTAQGEVSCTSNHKFYVKTRERKPDTNNNTYELSDFDWISADQFQFGSSQKRTFTSSVIDNLFEDFSYNGVDIGCNAYSTKHVKNLDTFDENFWYIIGRYLGDGYLYYKYRNGSKYLCGINICAGRNKSDFLTEKLELAMKRTKMNFYIEHKRTADCFQISSTELGLFLKQFGEHASDKFIPGFVMRLDKKCVLSLLAGYFDCDGYVDKNNKLQFSTISKKLAYGVKYLVEKYMRLSCSVYRKKQHCDVIEGRHVNVHDIYICSFKTVKADNSKYFIDSNYILAPVSCVEYIDGNYMVYNLSVEDDESYVADGFVVHNCTHLALSGAMHFEKKRNDGRQRDGIEFFCRFFNADCDRIVIENPKNIISGGEYIRKWFPDLAEKYKLPRKCSQVIHPWMFGDPYCNGTCLWIKGLPNLIPDITEEPETEWIEYVSKKGKRKRMQKWFSDAFTDNPNDSATRSRIRSKTFDGIARAMATQWSNFCKLSEDQQTKLLNSDISHKQLKLF